MRKMASAALDEVLPWPGSTSEAGIYAAQTRVAEYIWCNVRSSSIHDGKVVAGNGALPYHHALH